ncbi:MAG: hypothetical protein ACLVBP_03555 [Ruminococcus sp.]
MADRDVSFVFFQVTCMLGLDAELSESDYTIMVCWSRSSERQNRWQAQIHQNAQVPTGQL